MIPNVLSIASTGPTGGPPGEEFQVRAMSGFVKLSDVRRAHGHGPLGADPRPTFY